MSCTKQPMKVDIWRTCNKLRAAIFRMGINLFESFSPLDPHKSCLISESQFISVLNSQFRAKIGLSEREVAELADAFRVPDGRIYYTQLCQVIHAAIPHIDQNEVYSKSPEISDRSHCNTLSVNEERTVNVLITKISSLVNIKKLLISPYFQDYELVSKSNSLITIAHFARVLDFLKLPLSPEEFTLLVKKFITNSYTLNYFAFINSIVNVKNYLQEHGLLDLSGDILKIFPGKAQHFEFPKLPRPQITKAVASNIFGNEHKLNPALKDPKKVEHILNTVANIKDHVSRYKMRISEFFDKYDFLKCGKISVSQFLLGLDSLALCGKQRLFLSLPDIEALIQQYKDPTDPARLCWKTFEEDINQGQDFNRKSDLESAASPKALQPQPKCVDRDWKVTHKTLDQLCQEAVEKVKQKISQMTILIKPVFRDYDKQNNGHVRRDQMKWALHSNGILLSEEELFALEDKYNNDMGFNYFRFLNDVEPKTFEEPSHNEFLSHGPEPKEPHTRPERNIIHILSKIKGEAFKRKIKVTNFFRDWDSQYINRSDFHTGLVNCGFELTKNEEETLIEVFASPLCNSCVDHKRFCNAIGEPSVNLCLEKSSLEPVQLTIKSCKKAFLNFEERNLSAIAIQKLSKRPDLQMNLPEILRAFDTENNGTVSESEFLKALTLCGMYNLISSREYEVLCKANSFEQGKQDEIDYRAFLKALDILYATDKYNPF